MHDLAFAAFVWAAGTSTKVCAVSKKFFLHACVRTPVVTPGVHNSNTLGVVLPSVTRGRAEVRRYVYIAQPELVCHDTHSVCMQAHASVPYFEGPQQTCTHGTRYSFLLCCTCTGHPAPAGYHIALKQAARAAACSLAVIFPASNMSCSLAKRSSTLGFCCAVAREFMRAGRAVATVAEISPT